MEYKNYIQKTDFGKIKLYQADCMEMLPQVPDKYYDLCICDPPYGIGASKGVGCTRGVGVTKYVMKDWDLERPESNYFNELLRVTKNQIICGGNYFADLLPPSRCWVYWQKNMGGNYADGELIYTSFDNVVTRYEKRSETFNRFHPTQKPVALYQWLLKNYAKQGDRILDTHLGSGSSAIAADIMGFDFTGIEIDKDYYEAALDRFNRHKQQLVMEF
jgi:site-specific DNA-methyltransferase (adenine-specific)